MKHILTRREKLILYATAGVVAFALAYSCLIAPFLDKNAALEKRIALTTAKLNTYRRLLSQKDSLRKKYDKLYSSLKVSGREEDTLVGVLSQLESLAKEANIHLIDIRPQVPGEKEVIINLKAEGTAEGYLKFIYSIEHSALLLKIKKFQLAAKAASQALEGSFTVSFVPLGVNNEQTG
jgi:hypothetical protein